MLSFSAYTLFHCWFENFPHPSKLDIEYSLCIIVSCSGSLLRSLSACWIMTFPSSILKVEPQEYLLSLLSHFLPFPWKTVPMGCKVWDPRKSCPERSNFPSLSFASHQLWELANHHFSLILTLFFSCKPEANTVNNIHVFAHHSSSLGKQVLSWKIAEPQRHVLLATTMTTQLMPQPAYDPILYVPLSGSVFSSSSVVSGNIWILT